MALVGVSENVERYHRETLEKVGKQWSVGITLLVAKYGEAGLMEQVCEDMLEGVSFKSCAEGRGVKQGELARWIMSDEQREKEWESLLRVKSDLMMYDTLDIADATDPEFVGVSKLRIEQRNKLASKWFKSRYGDDSKLNVNIGGGSLVAILAALPVGMRPQIEDDTETTVKRKVERVIEAEVEADTVDNLTVDNPQPVSEPVSAEPGLEVKTELLI